MVKPKLFRTDIFCSICGGIQTVQLQGHQEGVNHELKTWCYRCKKGTIHILMGEKDRYLINLDSKIKDKEKLIEQENIAVKVLKRKKKDEFMGI